MCRHHDNPLWKGNPIEKPIVYPVEHRENLVLDIVHADWNLGRIVDSGGEATRNNCVIPGREHLRSKTSQLVKS